MYELYTEFVWRALSAIELPNDLSQMIYLGLLTFGELFQIMVVTLKSSDVLANKKVHIRISRSI